MERLYRGFIFTNHALTRLQERGISQSTAWAVLKHPDTSRYAATKGAWVYYRTWGKERIEVVAAKNERREWVVLSVWSKPIWPNQSKAPGHGFWGELWRKLFGKTG